MISFQDARAEFHYRYANLLLRLRRSEAAANAFGRVLRLRPDDPHLQFQRAWSLVHVPHRRVEGIESFKQLMKTSPSASGYYLMACALQHESRHEEAVEMFREALRLDSTSPDVHYNHAVSLTELRRLEDAAEAYENAAHLSPSDGEAWGNLGAVYAELGRCKDAAPCLQRAMRLTPNVLHGLALGYSLLELNRLDEAERVVRDSIALDPHSAEARHMLAHVLSDLGRYEEALALAREILAENPGVPSSRVVLGYVLLEVGRLEEALQEATAAVELAPLDPRAHSLLGGISVKKNDGAMALAAFDRMAVCIDSGMERLPLSARVWCDAGRGGALSLLGRHEEAMRAFQRVLHADHSFFERWPDWAPYYHRSRQETGRMFDS